MVFITSFQVKVIIGLEFWFFFLSPPTLNLVRLRIKWNTPLISSAYTRDTEGNWLRVKSEVSCRSIRECKYCVCCGEGGRGCSAWVFWWVCDKAGFSSSHVWMWELNHKESWASKNWCFWTVVLEKTLESPLHGKEIQPVRPKDHSWIFFGRTDAEAETPMLWPPDTKTHLKRSQCWER